MKSRKYQVGDAVTSLRPVKPYSGSAWNYDGRMFAPGTPGVVVTEAATVLARKQCDECGKRQHATFYCVEFDGMDGQRDRVALRQCNIVAS